MNAILTKYGTGYKACPKVKAPPSQMASDMSFLRVCQKHVSSCYPEGKEPKNILKDKSGFESLSALVYGEEVNVKGQLKEIDSFFDNEQYFKIKDLLRCMVFANSCNDLIRAYNEIRQKYNVVEVKNKLTESDPKIAKVLFMIIEYNGVLAEIQIFPGEFNTLKKNMNHLFYELVRHDCGVFIALAERRNKDVCWFN